MTEDLKRGVLGLLDDLQKNQAQSLSERDVCRIYIEPLFALLGWNLRNPEEVKEQVSQPQGRPDYIFYLNGSIAFFLETKPFRELTETDIKQAINYGRSKNKRWSVLSNFKETMILLCDTKEDSIWKHIFRRISASDLPSHLEELLLLSKGGFEAGLIEKKAQDQGRTKRTVSIDDELLTDIISWRQKLLASIRKHTTQEYSRLELEEIVQTILDRIIFIRTVEDRRREARPDETIKGILNQYDVDKSISVKDRMNKLFRHYDDIYDSKLFTYDESKPDKRHECERVEIDNLTYSRVLRETYDKDEIYSYNFADIDADVLGAMYEKYIGTMQSKRKEQGIYYTPPFVVEYIVQNTLGKILKKTKAENFAKIRVLDMACGSGSFLLKSFDVLDRSYRQKDKDYSQTKLDSESDAAKMTRKAMILRNNIYGVDLDPKAVEIAQLNLLLKAAETRFRLPDLRDNIKCGNSLVGQSLDEELRPFDWSREFPETMNTGGFDVVMGNPPYVRQEELLKIKPYLEANYTVFHSMADLSVYFFEREINMLKDGGQFGMIVSNKWLKAGYGRNLRRFLSQYFIEQFIDFGDLRVFQDATTYPCVLMIRKIKRPNPKMRACVVEALDFTNLEEYVAKKGFVFDQRNLNDEPWNIKSQKYTSILDKIRDQSIPLREYIGGNVYRGVLTGLNKAFVIDDATRNALIAADPRSEEVIKPFLTGTEVGRYGLQGGKKFLIFTRRGIRIDDYPAIKKHLESFRIELTPRKNRQQRTGRKPGDYRWYEIQDVTAYFEEFERPKIVYGKITTRPRFILDTDGYYVNDSNFIIPIPDKHLLAILNSKFGWFLISNTCTQVRGGYQLIWRYFRNIPIPKKRSPELEKESERMIRLTERIHALGKKQTEERVKLEKEANETSKRIDDLVYDLYELTTEERGTVEDIMREI
jgi:type I restriction-modification system DNA methylase subunit